MELPVRSRKVAGQALAEELQEYKERDDVIVLALPRGGMPVAVEVAEALGAELDLMLVRKLGTPPDTVDMLCRQVDELVCLAEPEPLMAIGMWYVDFSQVSDDEVRHILEKTWRE